MCRMLAVSSQDRMTPMTVLKGLSVMREGYDGSGVGLFMRDLGGVFKEMKESPILSGIFSAAGIKRLDRHMLDIGFMTRYKISFKRSNSAISGQRAKKIHLIRAYDYPPEWDRLDRSERESRLMRIQLELKKMGEAGNDMIVFSFWPDTIFIKEIGDPLEIAGFLQLDRMDLTARIIMVQGRQNTNYGVALYACHPFFLQGFATMANGENTAFLPNREYLMSRGFPGYNGYKSDSEVFTHILHYTITRLNLGVEAFKHVITPLNPARMATHPNGQFLKHLKHACRQLIIDGPNCIVGCLPDNTVFMTQDSKKLRPGVVGGTTGTFVFSSEVCGLDAILPERDKSLDFQPMHLDTAIVDAHREQVKIISQTNPLPLYN